MTLVIIIDNIIISTQGGVYTNSYIKEVETMKRRTNKINHTCISEDLVVELEHAVCEMVDQKFTPSEKALKEIETGNDDIHSLFHKELSVFTCGVIKISHDRIQQKYSY